MRKEFSINNDKVLINFTAKYCTTHEMLLDSDAFKRTLETYLKKAQNKKSNSYRYLTDAIESNDIHYIRKTLIIVFKLLTLMNVEEILEANINYKNLFKDKNEFIKLIEEFYLFWRSLERYTIIHTDRVRQGLAAMSFTEANSNFSRLILKLYRKIEENVLCKKPSVFRQIPVGGNCSIMINKVNWPLPKSYQMLQEINFIDCILIEPPFITYPKRNTRTGIFSEVKENPLKQCVINKEHWFCYPAKVGELLAYVYFHRDFMEHGITLCNLFEMAKREECRNKKPDIVYVFGGTDKQEDFKTVFYDDIENDIMLGYINHSEQIDYFGYMKKMILTLHNLIMIKRGYLPIHGAMVNIKLKSGKDSNVIIMGDSGAGKSESLEAFRALGKDNISDMTVIFDDMGTLKNIDSKVVAYGTEIGAFVRLDDLDQGYAFNEIDRSIFMNPDKINARLVMPITPYFEIINGYNVEIMLYANNYTEVSEGDKAIEFFENVDDAINVFKSGARMAKGTTSEKGLVESYFANPFGPVQMKEKTDLLIKEYFNLMFKNNIKVGQIKTCLGIKGQEKDGPRRAAKELLDIINE